MHSLLVTLYVTEYLINWFDVKGGGNIVMNQIPKIYRTSNDSIAGNGRQRFTNEFTFSVNQAMEEVTWLPFQKDILYCNVSSIHLFFHIYWIGPAWHGCQMAMPFGMVARYAKAKCKYMRNYLPCYHWRWERKAGQKNRFLSLKE